MTAGKMHADEVDTDASLVRRLLGAQFPQWADLSIEPVPSVGTDNALYRLGDEMAVCDLDQPGAILLGLRIVDHLGFEEGHRGARVERMRPGRTRKSSFPVMFG